MSFLDDLLLVIKSEVIKISNTLVDEFLISLREGLLTVFLGRRVCFFAFFSREGYICSRILLLKLIQAIVMGSKT
jgi:hypothetical protein